MQKEVMQRSKDALTKAQHYAKLANHILKITYPVVKEPKVLLLALENTFLASTNIIAAILYFERSTKTIPPFHDSFNSKLHVFSEKIAKTKGFSIEEYSYIEKIRDLLLFQKKSPVEFTRNEDFVLCSDEYDIEKITFEDTTKYLHKTTSLIKKIEMMI